MMKNSIIQNFRTWNDEYGWAKDGDEWDDEAKLCGVPYETWKRSLVKTLIVPHATGKAVLEIAPGHGRWSEYIIKVAEHVIMVDLSPNCIEICRKRFGDANNIEYHVNDGKSLPAHLTSEIDFVWSYDSFVHMDSDVIHAYFREFNRVLKSGGTAIIHHANRRRVYLAFLRNWGRGGTLLYRFLSQGWSTESDGWRSDVSAGMVAQFAQESGLKVEEQIQYWGEGRCGVPRFNDHITILRKP